MYFSKKVKFVFLLMVMILATAGQLWAQRRLPGGRIQIQLASLVPEATPWGAALNRMAAEWSAATNGEVELVIFHGGVAGSEAEVLRRLRLNQIQAAVFTSAGIREVMPEVMAISYPFLIRTDAELEAVMTAIRPELDAGIERSGFMTLAWTNAGWLRVFSRDPVFTPADLRGQRLGASPDDQEMLQLFRTMGFQVVPVGVNDTLVSLRANRMDAVYWSPVMVAGAQLFGVANNMSSMNLAPFMGGILMNQTAWRRIPERHRPRLLEISRQIEAEIGGAISALDEEAIAIMQRHGLRINEPTPVQRQEWYNEINRHEDRLVGTIFDRNLFGRISAVLQEFRGR